MDTEKTASEWVNARYTNRWRPANTAKDLTKLLDQVEKDTREACTARVDMALAQAIEDHEYSEESADHILYECMRRDKDE